VGQFAENGTVALAAVGSTGSASAMFLNIFIGMSIGVNVVCANFRGAKDEESTDRCMHTAIPLAAFCGMFVLIMGQLCCKPLLTLLGTPESLMDGAELYMRIFFVGVPGSLVYNFGANILRSNGDTKRPMTILGLSGLVNVALNLVLVIGCGMSVAGVAIATIIAAAVCEKFGTISLFSLGIHELARRISAFREMTTWE
jgi:Na+-driven multidrug efflux pump